MKIRDHIIAIVCIIALVALSYAVITKDNGGINKAAAQQDMTQFESDLEKYMVSQLGTEVATIDAKCKPDQGAYGTRCWITIGTTLGDTVEKATAENVRRVGAKFTWDQES